MDARSHHRTRRSSRSTSREGRSRHQSIRSYHRRSRSSRRLQRSRSRSRWIRESNHRSSRPSSQTSPSWEGSKRSYRGWRSCSRHRSSSGIICASNTCTPSHQSHFTRSENRSGVARSERSQQRHCSSAKSSAVSAHEHTDSDYSACRRLWDWGSGADGSIAPNKDPNAAECPITSVKHNNNNKTVVYAGHGFTVYTESKLRISYRCSQYRRAACKAKLHFIIKDNKYEFCGEHVCPAKRTVTAPAVNVTEEMGERTDELSITRMDLTAQKVWDKLREEYYPDDLEVVMRGLTREQVIRRVQRTRRSHFGADLHGVVEVPPLSLVPETNLPVFQFYRSYMNGTTLERLVGWAHPALINLLKYKKTTLFFDGTFRCVPRPFYQCVVVMVFDNATELFVPVFYILCSGKTQDTYWHLMEAVNVAADDKIQPSVVVCDFELALQQAAQVQFPDADLVGCYFHFKQACRRKLQSLSMPEKEICVAMSKGYLDILTVIPHEKIAGAGIRFVQKKTRTACLEKGIAYSDVLWKLFWQYFQNTWLKTYKPSVWNVYGLEAGMISRTNNPLERFNREINAALTAPHPSLPSFVAIIQAMSKRYVDRIDDIIRCRAQKRRRRNSEPVNLPDLAELSDSEELVVR